MIPKKDLYADKHGKLTNDMSKAAFQIAAKGCHLDDRTAKRYGITDELVSVDEPSAVRKVRMVIGKPEPVFTPEPEAEPEAEEPQTAAAKPAAKKDADKGDKKKS